MSNRLKALGESASWRLMSGAAVEGAKKAGFQLKRQPGRGLSNTYEATKNGQTSTVSVRTTRDRWVAFVPLDDGTRWKTLDDVDQVLVSAVDDPTDPQNVDVYLFPANEVRKRFDASRAARLANGHTVRDDYGMWVKLDSGDPSIPSQVGAGLADDYPRIARFTIDELEGSVSTETKDLVGETESGPEETVGDDRPPLLTTSLPTVAAVLAFARERIAVLTGMPVAAISLDLKLKTDA